MLEIGSKTITVDGITVFADHADPNQFWYLPAPIQLSRRREDNRAAFTLIKYRPAAAGTAARGGGFLMFEVNLRLDPLLERRIRSRLASIAPDRPRLAAVPFDEGTVECIALNLQGSGGTTAQVSPEGTFNAVERILGASTPSLHGDNSAAFSLQLSEEGATLVERAFEEEGVPIGVIYSLTYTGLRPALEVEITADYKRVYDHFSAGLDAQVYFLRAGIDAGFEKLVQDGIIEIKVINFSTADDRAEKEKWALDFFKDTLLRQWFEPTLTPGELKGGMATAESLDAVATRAQRLQPKPTPPPAKPGSQSPPGTPAPSKPGPDADANTGNPAPRGDFPNPLVSMASLEELGMPPKLGRIPALAGSGVQRSSTPTPSAANAAPIPLVVSFRLKFIRQEELKRLMLRYSRSEAVQRVYAPQGFFGLLMQDLSRKGHMIEVDLDDPFFREYLVTVEAPFDLKRIGLTSAHISLGYGDADDVDSYKHKDFIIDESAPKKQEWQVFINEDGDNNYTQQVQYHFDPNVEWEGEQFSYELPATITEDRTLLINPFAHLGFLEIELAPTQIDWGIVSAIEAHLRYESPGGWRREKSFYFTADDQANRTWQLRLSYPEARDYAYQFRFTLNDGRELVGEPVTTRATRIAVTDPFYGINIEFIPLYSPAQVRMVFIDVEYDDPENNYFRQERIQLAGGRVDPAPLRLSIIDPTKRTYSYRFTFIGTDNSLARGAWVETTETLIGVTR